MKKLIFLLIPAIAFGQVGINTTTPTATLDVNGNMRIRTIQTGNENDSILVTNNGFIKKISISSIGVKCPDFIKNKSNPYYVLFHSSGSVPNPNNPQTIEGLNFVFAETSIRNNIYIYSYTNTSGTPLNINNFSVFFGSKKCTYK